jgi:drug/metabolite transporter (DMT)-like permease
MLLKPLSARAEPHTVVIRLTLIAAPISAIIVGLAPPSRLSLSSLPLVLVLGPMAMLAIFATARAYRHRGVGELAPLEFLRFVAAALLGYSFFGERPDAETLIGGVLIILANVANARVGRTRSVEDTAR